VCVTGIQNENSCLKRSSRMTISLRLLLIATMRVLLPLAVLAVLPLSGEDNRAEDDKTNARNSFVTVLYQGPLVHDQDWTIKSGAPGPDNQKFRALGGTCSMIPSDIHN